MKLFKLITLSFVFALGLAIPAHMTFADSCGHSSDHANTTHPDNEHNGDHNCAVDTTVAPDTTDSTVVATTEVPPTDLPVTGSSTVVAVIAAILAAVGGVLLYVRKKF